MARILGIDLDSDSLRGAVVRTALRRVELERVIQIPLAERPGTPGRVVELTEAAATLLAALGTPPDTLIASLSGDVASLRTVEFPASASKRIAEILPFELETLLPFDPKDAVVDHQPLDTREGHVRVLAAAVPRERVRSALADLDRVGLEPRSLAVGAAGLDALPALMPELALDPALVLIEFGHEHTNLCVLERGRCALARTLSFGTTSLPRAAEALAHELQRTIAAYRAAGGEAPARGLLCGPGASAHGAASWFAHALGCPVERLGLPTPTQAESAPDAAFARAVALAARGAPGARRIDLRKGEFAPSRGAMRLADHLQLAATCVVVIVMAATFSLKAQQSLLADERAALRAQISEVTGDVFGAASTDPVEIDTMLANAESGDPLPRFDAFDALAAVSASVPEGMNHEIRRLRIDLAGEKREGTIELQGTLGTVNERDEIITELAKHACIKDIEPGRVTPAGNQYNYQIEAKLRCPGEEPVGKGKKRGGPP